jgi:hypothetical protein
MAGRAKLSPVSSLRGKKPQRRATPAEQGNIAIVDESRLQPHEMWRTFWFAQYVGLS